jgi:hypothetical protein
MTNLSENAAAAKKITAVQVDHDPLDYSWVICSITGCYSDMRINLLFFDNIIRKGPLPAG